MVRSPGGTSGFQRPLPSVASPRLTSAVAATLTLGALSLGFIVTLTVLSIKVAIPCLI